jgi:hypothetical protein
LCKELCHYGLSKEKYNQDIDGRDKSTEISSVCANDKVKIVACYPEVQHSRQVIDLLTPNSKLNQPFVKLTLASPTTSSSFGTPKLVNCGDLNYDGEECKVNVHCRPSDNNAGVKYFNSIVEHSKGSPNEICNDDISVEKPGEEQQDANINNEDTVHILNVVTGKLGANCNMERDPDTLQRPNTKFINTDEGRLHKHSCKLN